MREKSPPWFKDGLRFECTRCGACCSGSTQSVVWVSRRDCERYAKQIGIPLKKFLREYTRKVGRRRSLKSRRDGRCVLLADDGTCTVHQHKPRQCRLFPFWGSVLQSK